MDDYEARLYAKLAPDSMKQTLVRAGAFLSAYELIKMQVVEGVHDEYWRDIRDGKKVYRDAEYQREVLALDAASRFRASCAWLVDAGAFTQEQADVLGAVRDHRNQIAHELPKILNDPDFEVNTSLLLAATVCLRALDVYWGRMAMAIDPKWNGVDVADMDIWGGPGLLMASLLEIAGLQPGNAEAAHDE